MKEDQKKTEEQQKLKELQEQFWADAGVNGQTMREIEEKKRQEIEEEQRQ
jgi:hypothetical protein